jgi:hypothetical protein
MDMAGEGKKKLSGLKTVCGHQQHCQSTSTGNLRTNVTLKRVCATIVAVDEQ